MKEFYKVTDEKLYYSIIDDFKEDGGVYKLHCLKSKDSTEFRPIDRILGTDYKGILYIGKTKSLLERLVSLKKSVKPDYETLTHNTGKYYMLIKELRKKYPIDLLVVKIEKTVNPEELEKKLLKDYTLEFGELPPFNSKSEFMTKEIEELKENS